MIVSEYVEGQTLPDRLKAGPPLSVEEASLLAYRLATALEYAHSKGLLHSDLSAGNVTIAAGGTAHLIDEFAAPDPKSPGEVIGVSGDVPLERFEGSARLAKLENIYSLGVILYQALTGRLPFDLSMMERLKPTMRGEPAAPSRINPTIPQALDAVCLKAMAPQPADRYATAGEFAAALQPFLAAGALPAGPKKSGGRRKGFWK